MNAKDISLDTNAMVKIRIMQQRDWTKMQILQVRHLQQKYMQENQQ